jgi:hypothetical protein
MMLLNLVHFRPHCKLQSLVNYTYVSPVVLLAKIKNQVRSYLVFASFSSENPLPVTYIRGKLAIMLLAKTSGGRALFSQWS